MKKIVIIFAMLLLSISSVDATTNHESLVSTNEIISGQIDSDALRTPPVGNIEVVIITDSNEDECKVEITGRIGYNNTYLEVKIKVKAKTCEEAEDKAFASMARLYARLKKLVKAQMGGLH